MSRVARHVQAHQPSQQQRSLTLQYKFISEFQIFSLGPASGFVSETIIVVVVTLLLMHLVDCMCMFCVWQMLLLQWLFTRLGTVLVVLVLLSSIKQSSILPVFWHGVRSEVFLCWPGLAIKKLGNELEMQWESSKSGARLRMQPLLYLSEGMIPKEGIYGWSNGLTICSYFEASRWVN